MGSWHIIFTLGIFLAAGLLAGTLGELFRLPKVTAYLLIGVILGPAILDLIPHEHLEELKPLTDLAMALVLFGLGNHFTLSRLRRLFKRVLPLSIGEVLGTFFIVFVGLLLVGESPGAAILLGALAIATAPATTILVLKEMQSEGPISEYTGILVALNNLISIIAFEVIFVAVFFLQGDSAHASVLPQLGHLLLDIFGSVFIGVFGGLMISYGSSIIKGSRRLIMFVGLIALALGLCRTTGVPYMLTFLAMGFTVANSLAEEDVPKVEAELYPLTGFLCVLFFIIHGAELKPQQFIEAGLIGGSYIVLRLVGKYIGIFIPARMRGEEPEVSLWLGTALFAQAGAAIALSAIAVSRDPVLGGHLQTIILGSVVFFEIVGPIMIRQSVLRAGEVPLIHAIHHTAGDPISEFQSMIRRFLVSFGLLSEIDQPPDQILVEQLYRKNVKGIAQTATFNEVISFIEHSHDNTFPVIGPNEEVVGVIRYQDLSNTLFDPKIGSLVRAADLANNLETVVYPDDSLARVWSKFREGSYDCLPVVSREQPHRMLGVIRRWEILKYYIKGHRSAQNQDGK
ncbi:MULTISPECIES: cation:proton antiporter [Gimesia]|jgi:Kef-type K+ transport system membrane component KefB|uniref:CBS domain-containing protein n=2 Tax=Gimesia TaxID=1649453 RepID=A0A6I6AIT2_9PLAN|nr:MULTISPECIES: cation:proton antiporter [Gimesia]MCR9232657.1 cation:proton antiporter [bacterium]QDT21360.1 Inner membrane protein YbaL [Gimesia chilikensis]QDT84207.1 Inner membrane protein YbaL [Gimesia chilikensis]QGQ26683.1 CBS domain-containing protein [Gimesia benthica]